MSMSIRGIASGLDVDLIIDQLMALERRPISLLQRKQQQLEVQKNAWRDVHTRLRNLNDKFSALKLPSNYQAKAVDVGDSSVVSASAGTAAAEGTYRLNVQKLATGMSMASTNRVENASTALSVSGSLTITNSEDGDKTWTVEIGQEDSLNAIASKINKTEGIGVTASVVNNHLLLSSKDTGVASAFTVETTGDVGSVMGGFNQLGEDPQDAELTINGLQVTSTTNSLSNAIQGVTINLQAEGTSQLTVRSNTEPITKALEEFVNQYNSTMDFIGSKLARGGELQGDSTLLRLQSSLRQMVSSRAPHTSGEYTTLRDIGITTGAWNKDAPDLTGRLTLDKAKLEAALKADPLAVKDILFKQTNVMQLEGITLSGDAFSDQYPLASVIDGITDSTNWGRGQGWNSAQTIGADNPAELIVNFNATHTLEMVRLFTLNSELFPAAQFGVRDYNVYYLDNEGQRHLLAEVTDNERGTITHYADSIRATGLVFEFTAGNGGEGDYARVVEIEAHENSGIFYNLEQHLRTFIRSGDGILSEKQKMYDRQIDDIKKQVERMEDRLVMRQQTLVRQFTALERALSSMQSQGNWLNSQLATLNSMNNWKQKS